MWDGNCVDIGDSQCVRGSSWHSSGISVQPSIDISALIKVKAAILRRYISNKICKLKKKLFILYWDIAN